jgi:FAD/FMN-containing dehydrogenase
MSAFAHALTRSLPDRLRQLVGAEHVRDDPATCAFFSHDIYSRAAHPAAVVVAPGSTDELSRVVALATSEGRAIVARGSGMSYTGGYLPDEPHAVMLDMTRMNRILSVNAEDMTVTVEAGASWAALMDALKPKGLRTPFWGPLSGLLSTIGGGLSQNNAFFGAAAHGAAGDSVTALKVVLADGSILETGSASTKNGPPFFRHCGPDLTGLFIGDNGAFGVKAEATLRLIEAPKAEGSASFAFATREATAASMSALARAGVACELFGFDPNLQRVRMKRASLATDAKALAGVVKGQKSILAGVKEAARIALAGRDFVDEAEYSVHVVSEGRSEAAVSADLAAARAIAKQCGGREIENTIPKVTRANPFGPLNAVIGPHGERWAPVHGILPHSRAGAAWADIDVYFATMAREFEEMGVSTGCLITTLSTNAFLIEPVFYWPEALEPLHKSTVEPSMLKKVTEFPSNPDATRLVARARQRVADIFLAHGASHFQIAKTYPFREGRKDAAWALLESLKSALDPARRLNPGSLGLR